MMNTDPSPSRRQRLAAFLLGIAEFRSDYTTNPGDDLISSYDLGREYAHRLTFRRWDGAR